MKAAGGPRGAAQTVKALWPHLKKAFYNMFATGSQVSAFNFGGRNAATGTETTWSLYLVALPHSKEGEEALKAALAPVLEKYGRPGGRVGVQ